MRARHAIAAETATCGLACRSPDAPLRSGAHCEYPAVKCPGVPLWCYNGGNCTATRSGTYTCVCPADWAGGSCQKLMSSALVPPPKPGTVAVPTWVAAPIIVGIVLLLLLLFCVCFMAYRERKGRPVFQKLENEAVTPTRRQQLARWSAEEVAKEEGVVSGGGAVAHPALFSR